VEPGPDGFADQGADQAAGVEAQQAPRQGRAAQPLLPEGQAVVEGEVPGHGRQDGAGLAQPEREVGQTRQGQHGQVRGQARRAHQEEQAHAGRDRAAGALFDQQRGQVDDHPEVKLGLAAGPGQQGGGNLGGGGAAVMRGDHIDQNLEPHARKARSHRLVPIAAHQEASAERIGQAQAQQSARQAHARPAEQVAVAAQAAFGAVQIAAGHHQFGVGLVQPAQHPADQARIVLAVAVHDRQGLAARGVPAGDRRRGETAGSHPADQPHGPIAPGAVLDDLGGAIVHGIIDDDDFVRDVRQVGADGVQHAADGLVFVQGADHQGYARTPPNFATPCEIFLGAVESHLIFIIHRSISRLVFLYALI
jgi:hypothetical protein